MSLQTLSFAASDRVRSAVREPLVRQPARRQRIVRIGLLGLGCVGQGVAAVCRSEAAHLRRRGLRLQIVSALVRDPGKQRGDAARRVPLTTRLQDLLAARCDVVIEALGGVEPAHALVRSVLEAGVSVVSANKSLIAHHGPELADLAARCGVSLRSEAAVIAGVPFLDALARRPLGARVDCVAGILNATSNTILSALRRRGATFATALQEAVTAGYAEPAPEADLTGRDAAEKLCILLQRLGLAAPAPHEIDATDLRLVRAADVQCAPLLGGEIRPVALARRTAAGVEAFVGPALVPHGHALCQIDGVSNSVILSDAARGAVQHTGPGAGPAVTAATLLDDVVETVSQPRGRLHRPQGAGASVALSAPRTAWLLRFDLHEHHPGFGSIFDALGSRGLTVSQAAGARSSGRSNTLYLLIEPQSREVIEAALRDVSASLGVASAALRVLPS